MGLAGGIELVRDAVRRPPPSATRVRLGDDSLDCFSLHAVFKLTLRLQSLLKSVGKRHTAEDIFLEFQVGLSCVTP